MSDRTAGRHQQGDGSLWPSWTPSPGLEGHGFEIVRYRGGAAASLTLRQLDEVPGLLGKADDGRAALTVRRLMVQP